jgi:hypothetical protein
MITDQIKDLLPTLSHPRRELAEKLLRLPWFTESDPAIQLEVLTLPKDFEGYVEDLSNRPDEIGELDIIRLTKVVRGNFLITSVFAVRSNLTNQEFSYEYVSWKTGGYTGMRGIIFLENEGEITHFIVGRKFKFASSEQVYESIGGLFFKIEDHKGFNLAKKIEDEICFHLGLKEIIFSRAVDLGRVFPDLGMTNNSSTVFAAVINITNIPLEISKDDFLTSHKLVNFETKLVHIDEFPEYIKKIDDSYFLATAARILVSKELSLSF